MTGVRLVPPFRPEPVLVRLARRRSRAVSTRSGTTVSAHEMDVAVDGRCTRALVRADLPLRADHRFQLVG